MGRKKKRNLRVEKLTSTAHSCERNLHIKRKEEGHKFSHKFRHVLSLSLSPSTDILLLSVFFSSSHFYFISPSVIFSPSCFFLFPLSSHLFFFSFHSVSHLLSSSPLTFHHHPLSPFLAHSHCPSLFLIAAWQ